MIVLLYRPLLLATVSPEMAAARGDPGARGGRPLPAGAGPGDGARRDHDRDDPQHRAPDRPRGDGAAADPAAPGGPCSPPPALGLAATWIGIVLAYDSYHWPPYEHGWPVSFFVVALVFAIYLLSGLVEWLRERRA